MTVSGDEDAGGPRVFRAQGRGPFQCSRRFRILTQSELSETELIKVTGRKVGVEAHGLVDESNRFFGLSRQCGYRRQGHQSIGIVGIERDGAFRVGKGLFVKTLE